MDMLFITKLSCKSLRESNIELVTRLGVSAGQVEETHCEDTELGSLYMWENSKEAMMQEQNVRVGRKQDREVIGAKLKRQ